MGAHSICALQVGAGKLPEKNALRKRLQALAESLETQRKALVASKEGEGISGEEKPREEIGTLYGNVNVYEGRPTESQRQRMGVLGKQLDAAAAAFEATLAKEGAAVNRELAKRKLPPLTRLTREEWDKRARRADASAPRSSYTSATAAMRPGRAGAWESLRMWLDYGVQPTPLHIQGACSAVAPLFGGPCRFDPTFVIPNMDGRSRPRQ